jgi:hypothetical protein
MRRPYNPQRQPSIGGPTRRSIAAMVGAFKSAAARRIDEIRVTSGQPFNVSVAGACD